MEQKKVLKCLTINTDASFCRETNAAGFAFYIICDDFKIQYGGKFKRQPADPEAAEIMCIGNAIGECLRTKNLPEFKNIVLNSDCKNGMKKIQLKTSVLATEVAELWQKLIIKTKAPKFSMRFVKAHQEKNKDTRSHVNTWCDMIAKNHMRQERQRIKFNAK